MLLASLTGMFFFCRLCKIGDKKATTTKAKVSIYQGLAIAEVVFDSDFDLKPF
jgi:hypothetical protein